MADATIVAVGLDPLVHHFAVPLSAGQEVLSVYLVAITATLPTLGRLGDRFGRRRVYLAGLRRLRAGLGAGRPGAVVRDAAGRPRGAGGRWRRAHRRQPVAHRRARPRGRTGRSVAVLVITQAIAGLAGPPLGGILVAVGGWQAIFWAGLPMAAIGAALALRFVPAGDERRPVRLDVAGSILTATLLLGIGAGIASLGGPVVGDAGPEVWFSVAWVSLLLLVPTELIARRPVIDGRLLRNPRFAAATVATLLSTGTLMSCFAVLPFWLEQAHGTAPIVAGLAFVPIAVGIGVTSRRGGTAQRRRPHPAGHRGRHGTCRCRLRGCRGRRAPRRLVAAAARACSCSASATASSPRRTRPRRSASRPATRWAAPPPSSPPRATPASSSAWP